MPNFIALAHKLAELKAAEAAAKAARIACESEIFAAAQASGLLANTEQGAGTDHVGPVTVSRSERRSWEQDKLHHMAAEIPPEISPIRAEYKVDTRALKALEESHPHIHKKLLGALTTRLAKPSFKISEEISA